MAIPLTSSTAFTFSDFPEDVQVCILSFLNQSELARFECTSRRYLSLCRDDHRLWFSMCDRRWGSNTIIKKWGNGKISYKLLYKFLLEYETLIGFWRRSGNGSTSTTATSSPASSSVSPPSPLAFFEWGSFYITGSRVLPSENGTYDVIKSPFLWISLNSRGKPVTYLDLDGKFSLSEKFVDDSGELGDLDSDLIPVDFSFIGKCYFVIEERLAFDIYTNWSSNGLMTKVSSSGNMRGKDCEDVYGSPGSFPDRLMSEIYQHIANRTSPGGNGSWRRQKKREKEILGRRKLEPEHFIKIVNYSPVPSRPLQGLWKGISDDINLEFYLITYDDIGGMSCRRVEDSSSRPFNGHTPVFWTSNTRLMEPPFSAEEQHLYDSRVHLMPPSSETDDDFDGLPRFTDPEGVVVSGMIQMNSSYDLAIPGTTINHRQGEGRVWRYENGTIGFGFLRNNCIVDLKLIAQDGHLMDALDFF